MSVLQSTQLPFPFPHLPAEAAPPFSCSHVPKASSQAQPSTCSNSATSCACAGPRMLECPETALLHNRPHPDLHSSHSQSASVTCPCVSAPAWSPRTIRETCLTTSDLPRRTSCAGLGDQHANRLAQLSQHFRIVSSSHSTAVLHRAHTARSRIPACEDANNSNCTRDTARVPRRRRSYERRPLGGGDV